MLYIINYASFDLNSNTYGVKYDRTRLPNCIRLHVFTYDVLASCRRHTCTQL